MPLLNLSRVAKNPKFVQKVLRVVRQESVNEFGENILTTTTSQIKATITMASQNDLNRFTDATVYIKAINVITTTELNADRVGYQPDIIIFQGDSYIIKGTFTYNVNGFTRAIAVLSDYQLAQAG